MKFQKFFLSLGIVLNVLLVFFLVAHLIDLNEKLREKTLTIQNLQNETAGLESEIASLEQEVKKIRYLLQNISREEKFELRDPTWDELRIFLEVDDTNELIYSKSFDCSGFAIELFKRARNVGLKCAFVEIEFEGEGTGHVLNAFQTDRGLIFVDVTGNEEGNGKDKIAYVKTGTSYGTIDLEGLLERRIDCNVDCEQFTQELSYVDYANLFDYDYFLEVKKCKELYEKCVETYNQAIEWGNYTYAELNKWYQNLEKLRDEIGSERYYYISEGKIVKDVEIYW